MEQHEQARKHFARQALRYLEMEGGVAVGARTVEEAPFAPDRYTMVVREDASDEVLRSAMALLARKTAAWDIWCVLPIVVATDSIRLTDMKSGASLLVTRDWDVEHNVLVASINACGLDTSREAFRIACFGGAAEAIASRQDPP